jgi:hypothetical protein
MEKKNWHYYQNFACKVSQEMKRLRGYADGRAPHSVIDDIFATMAKHDTIYRSGLKNNRDPLDVARDIQHAEWDNR